MTNLIIGLCFGIAAAIALAVMWRMVEKFRKEARFDDGQVPGKGHTDPCEDPPAVR